MVIMGDLGTKFTGILCTIIPPIFIRIYLLYRGDSL
jgi:hypothetical protein